MSTEQTVRDIFLKEEKKNVSVLFQTGSFREKKEGDRPCVALIDKLTKLCVYLCKDEWYEMISVRKYNTAVVFSHNILFDDSKVFLVRKEQYKTQSRW